MGLMERISGEGMMVEIWIAKLVANIALWVGVILGYLLRKGMES